MSDPKSIPRRNSWKTHVSVSADEVTKSLSHHKGIYRWAGRWFLDREQCALQRLEGLTGVPDFIARPNPDCLVMSRIDGIPLKYCYEIGISEAFFENLKVLIDSMHRRGVGHGDANHRNILVAGD